MSVNILSFDFGTKSIGVAVGQQITYTAQPLDAIKVKNLAVPWNLIENLIKEWQPDLIVVGLPLNMDGSDQEITKQAKKFANRIHGRFGKQIQMQDERLTTTDAKARLFELGGYKKLTKGKIDSVSAVLILESWFESNY